jgi:hypothetical protein
MSVPPSTTEIPFRILEELLAAGRCYGRMGDRVPDETPTPTVGNPNRDASPGDPLPGAGEERRGSESRDEPRRAHLSGIPRIP